MVAITPFKGARWQRGYGLGSIFRSLIRTAVPLFKSRVGKSIMKAGVGLAGDAIKGRNMKQALRSRFTQGIGDAMNTGSGRKQRRGRRPLKRAQSGPKSKRPRKAHHGDIFA